MELVLKAVILWERLKDWEQVGFSTTKFRGTAIQLADCLGNKDDGTPKEEFMGTGSRPLSVTFDHSWTPPRWNDF